MLFTNSRLTQVSSQIYRNNHFTNINIYSHSSASRTPPPALPSLRYQTSVFCAALYRTVIVGGSAPPFVVVGSFPRSPHLPVGTWRVIFTLSVAGVSGPAGAGTLGRGLPWRTRPRRWAVSRWAGRAAASRWGSVPSPTRPLGCGLRCRSRASPAVGS